MIATWIGGLFTVHFPAIDVKLIVTMALACFSPKFQRFLDRFSMLNPCHQAV
jgi:hypothetical protein